MYGLLTSTLGCELAEVSVVISTHLVVKDLSVSCFRIRDQVLVNNVEDIVADLFKLLLNFLSVPFDDLQIVAALVLFFVLNGRDCSPCSSAGSYRVFVCNRK